MQLTLYIGTPYPKEAIGWKELSFGYGVKSYLKAWQESKIQAIVKLSDRISYDKYTREKERNTWQEGLIEIQ